MSNDDPFNNSDDPDKTILRPTPGGSRSSASTQAQVPTPPPPTPAQPAYQPQSPQAYQSPPAPISEDIRTGSNTLLDSAAQLLSLIGRLKRTLQHRDVDTLHRQTIQSIQSFENRARANGATPEAIIASRYALCAAIDEAVLNTPWGSDSVWSYRSMLSTFHKETGGGEKFFMVLDRIRQEPATNLNLIELYATILALGFEGKYSVMPNGRAQLDGLRDELFRIIRMQRGEYERDLSPHWQGVNTGINKLTQRVPLWVVGALTGAVMLSIYLGFNMMLHGLEKPVIEKFETISQMSSVLEKK